MRWMPNGMFVLRQSSNRDRKTCKDYLREAELRGSFSPTIHHLELATHP
jgi:hypothetical protein